MSRIESVKIVQRVDRLVSELVRDSHVKEIPKCMSQITSVRLQHAGKVHLSKVEEKSFTAFYVHLHQVEGFLEMGE